LEILRKNNKNSKLSASLRSRVYWTWENVKKFQNYCKNSSNVWRNSEIWTQYPKTRLRWLKNSCVKIFKLTADIQFKSRNRIEYFQFGKWIWTVSIWGSIFVVLEYKCLRCVQGSALSSYVTFRVFFWNLELLTDLT